MQEDKDAKKLQTWKQALKGKGKCKCCDEVRDYLDEKLPGWRDDNVRCKKINKIVDETVTQPIRKSNKCKEKQTLIIEEDTDSDEEDEPIEIFDDEPIVSQSPKELDSESDEEYEIIEIFVDEPIVSQSSKELDTESDEEDEPIEISGVIEKKQQHYKGKKSAILQRQKVWMKSEQQQMTDRFKTECELTKYHQKYLTMRSDNLARRFQSNRNEFIEYHRIRDENMETFNQSARPHEIIIAELNKIKTKRKKIVVDMGCGLAKIAKHFKDDKRFEFTNYDHISTAENIIECDISHMPLEDDSVEICIMSLAMWGSNCKEYLVEACRVLETGGKLYIIDTIQRWSHANEKGTIAEGTEGDKLKKILCESGFQIISKRIDKWCMFVCEKV